ncbi:MAG: hypothetical protein HYT48_00210 [Candidatus Vogelbacteria bacterium]|nr:hypothetical protein [Candidatus Vogelbacteria bacterium]
MARPKSELLSAFGSAFEIWKALTNEVLGQGGNDESMRRFLTDPDLRREVAKLVVGNHQEESSPTTPTERPIYRVTVRDDLTLKEQIVLGHYDWTNPDINQKNFPGEKRESRETDVALFHFDRSIGSDEVEREMDKVGYRPATLPELLGLGVSQPELQRFFPIIALGSVGVVFGRRGVAYLDGGGAERDLRLDYRDVGWLADCRFAGVRKQVSAS